MTKRFKTKRLLDGKIAVVGIQFDVRGCELPQPAILEIASGTGSHKKIAETYAKRLQHSFEIQRDGMFQGLPFTFEKLCKDSHPMDYQIHMRGITFKTDFGPWKKGEIISDIYFDILQCRLIQYNGLEVTECPISFVRAHEQ